MARVEIPVEGMHCGGCERTLSTALKRLDGVRDAQADRVAGKVKVSFDEARVREGDLREQIEQVGYEAG
jgi:copper chaperone CopZ